MMTMTLPARERFVTKIDFGESNDNCWLWDAGKTTAGYGIFWNGTTMQAAHIFSYQMFRGPVPEGLQLDHLCRVRHCVNPQHLEPVTQMENMRRGMTWEFNRRKTQCPRGHLYTSDNLINAASGKRRCKACERERSNKYNKRKRTERNKT